MNLLDAALVASVVHGLDAFDGDVKAWCQRRGVSRSTAYRHRQRIKAEGAWVPRSRRPKTPSAHATADPVRALVIEVRQRLRAGENGAETIGYELAKVAERDGWAAKGWKVPSRATIHKIIRQAGLVVAEPNKRPRSSLRRFAYARPRDCYQIDATNVALADGTLVAVFEVLDDCTRALVASLAWAVENTTGAVNAMRRAFADYGPPAIVLSDNGMAFCSRINASKTTRFTRLITDAGARQIHSTPHHPQTCGKVERHHRTFKHWLAAQPPPATLTDLQELCDQYQHWYNTERHHSAWNRPPQAAWDAAPDYGGPQHLPVQTDASVLTRLADSSGRITVRAANISLGIAHARTQVTVLIDASHVIVYSNTGDPLGHLTLDHTKRNQGRLHQAA